MSNGNTPTPMTPVSSPGPTNHTYVGWINGLPMGGFGPFPSPQQPLTHKKLGRPPKPKESLGKRKRKPNSTPKFPVHQISSMTDLTQGEVPLDTPSTQLFQTPQADFDPPLTQSIQPP
ncbi:hypothetical protein LXL04_010020 [Taraxacum kok-saghyz]